MIWVLTAAAIVKYFLTETHDQHRFTALIAPALSGLGLAWIVVLLLKNWDLQTGMPGTWASYLPLTIAAVLALGFLLPPPAKTEVGTPKPRTTTAQKQEERA